MGFSNVYESSERAEAYAKLTFPGTYYLAYRDLPEIIGRHARTGLALDFGCGTGRSTRFLESLGFDVIGVDISEDMIGQARAVDTDGDYRLITDGDLSQFAARRFDLVLAAFTFDNIPTMDHKTHLFSELATLLKVDGRIVNLVSSPEIYTHEWVSFSTRDFPENHMALSGDAVMIIMTDVEDSRPVEDIVCSDDDYRTIYRDANLEALATYRPLGTVAEPFEWVTETRIAPWTIHVLGKSKV